MNTKYRGNLAENLAVKFLIRKGFIIILRNYLIKGAEIDIITYHKETRAIVFVEVRSKWANTRLELTNDFIWPEDSVNQVKIKKLERAANHFLYWKESTWNKFFNKSKLGNDFPNWRIDLISIVCLKKEKKAIIKHYEYVY